MYEFVLPLPDNSLSIDVFLQRICHFLPSKHTCLAYDSEIRWFAVGCETGEIAVYPSHQCIVL